MIQLSTNKSVVGPWVFQQIDKVWHPNGRECVGLVNEEGVLAGTVVEEYTGASVQMHIAVKHPHVPLRKFIVAGFSYVFADLGVEQALGIINSTNLKSLNFALKLGFEPIAIIPDTHIGSDSVILRLLRKNCRWLPQHIRQAA